jgi:hypothetical protein
MPGIITRLLVLLLVLDTMYVVRQHSSTSSSASLPITIESHDADVLIKLQERYWPRTTTACSQRSLPPSK